MRSQIRINIPADMADDCLALLGALVTDQSHETFRYLLDDLTADLEGTELVNALASMLLGACINSKALLLYVERNGALSSVQLLQCLAQVDAKPIDPTA